MITIDVRSEEEYTQGHAENSINIPLPKLEEYLTREHIPKDTSLTICCESGMRAQYAVDMLQKLGFQNVKNGGSWRAVSL